MNSFTGIFQQHFKSPMLPPCIDLSSPNQILKSTPLPNGGQSPPCSEHLWETLLTAGGYSIFSHPPAAKCASQGDAHVGLDAQIKFLYYSLAMVNWMHVLFIQNLLKFVRLFLRFESCMSIISKLPVFGDRFKVNASAIALCSKF